MRKPKNLDERLEEAIREFGKRLDRNPSVGPYLNVSNYVKGVLMTGELSDNPFEILSSLARRLREAYESGTFLSLELVPNLTGSLRDNSITYSSMGIKFQPFSNDTTGEKVSLIKVVFSKISRAAGGLPMFYRYLNSLVDNFCEERDALRDEIVNSESYKEAENRLLTHYQMYSKKGVIAGLRISYWVEELRRAKRVIELAKKAEVIYGHAAELFDGVRQYKPA